MFGPMIQITECFQETEFIEAKENNALVHCPVILSYMQLREYEKRKLERKRFKHLLHTYH